MSYTEKDAYDYLDPETANDISMTAGWTLSQSWTAGSNYDLVALQVSATGGEAGGSGPTQKFDYNKGILGWPVSAGWGVQTFTATEGYTLNKIRLYLKKDVDEGESFTATVYLYGVDGSHQPNSLLATMGSKSDADITTSYAWYSFEDTTYELTELVEYAIVVKVARTGTPSLYWSYAGDLYNGYAWWAAYEDFGSWTSVPGDFHFETYSSDGTPGGTFTGGIYSTSGGAPTGSALGTFSTFIVNWYEPTWTDYIIMDSAVSIFSGTKYAIVFDVIPAGQGLTLYYDTENTYSGGEIFYKLAGVPVWIPGFWSDIVFRTYATSPPPKTENPTPADDATKVDKNITTFTWEVPDE